MPDQDAEARRIAEDLLERTADALITGDFEAFHPCFVLPQIIDASPGQIELHTLADLRRTFDGVRNYHHRISVTDIVRRCISAEFVDPDTVMSTHSARLLSGSFLVNEAVPVLSRLIRTPDGWKIAATQYAVAEDEGLLEALMGRRRA